MLSGLARQTSAATYAFTGQRRTLHSFAELSSLNLGFEAKNLRRFLDVSVIFELRGKRRIELEETPEACALRLSEATTG